MLQYVAGRHRHGVVHVFLAFLKFGAPCIVMYVRVFVCACMHRLYVCALCVCVHVRYVCARVVRVCASAHVHNTRIMYVSVWVSRQMFYLQCVAVCCIVLQRDIYVWWCALLSRF